MKTMITITMRPMTANHHYAQFVLKDTYHGQMEVATARRNAEAFTARGHVESAEFWYAMADVVAWRDES